MITFTFYILTVAMEEFKMDQLMKSEIVYSLLLEEWLIICNFVWVLCYSAANLFILSREVGGHWTVNYTGIQSFITKLSCWLKNSFQISNSSVQTFPPIMFIFIKGGFCLSSLETHINLSSMFLSLKISGTKKN